MNQASTHDMEIIKGKKKFWVFAGCILLCEIIGITSGLLSDAGNNAWFDQVVKPSWNPPSWLFGPVWTLLYLLMGISLAKIRLTEATGRIKRLGYFSFGVQLFLNFCWSLIFFRFHSPSLAFADILLMLAAIAVTIGVFSKISKTAAVLLLPYLAWVIFASVLNFAIWTLN